MAVFLVEDGTGLPDSTSYSEVIEADEYLELRPEYTEWSALTIVQRENLLMRATSLIDRFFCWYGQRVVETQALAWPQTGVCDRHGFTVPSNIVPQPIKDAAAELAFYIFSNDTATSSVEGGGGGGSTDDIQRVKIDVIEIEFQETARSSSGFYASYNLPESLKFILNGYGFLCRVGLGSKPISRA